MFELTILLFLDDSAPNFGLPLRLTWQCCHSLRNLAYRFGMIVISLHLSKTAHIQFKVTFSELIKIRFRFQQKISHPLPLSLAIFVYDISCY